VSGENDRPFCQAATERGILLAPGDCFDAPSHFRLGFAAAGDNFSKALDRFGAFVKSWSAKTELRANFITKVPNTKGTAISGQQPNRF